MNQEIINAHSTKFMYQLYDGLLPVDYTRFFEFRILRGQDADFGSMFVELKKQYLSADLLQEMRVVSSGNNRLFFEFSLESMPTLLKAVNILQKSPADTYFTPHLFKKQDPTNLKSDFVLDEARLHFLDLDFKMSKSAEIRAISTAAEATDLLNSLKSDFMSILGAFPSATFSGGGMHLYFNPKRVITDDSLRWKDLQKALKHCGVFKAGTLLECVDNAPLSHISSILRLPYSMNYKKDYDEPRLIEIINFQDNSVLDEAVLEPIAESLRLENVRKVHSISVRETTLPVFQIDEDDIEDVGSILRKYYVKGFRNNLQFSFIGHCARQHVDPASLLKMLDIMTVGEREFGHTLAELERSVDDAYSRVEDGQSTVGYIQLKATLEDAGSALRFSDAEIEKDKNRITGLTRNPENRSVVKMSDADIATIKGSREEFRALNLASKTAYIEKAIEEEMKTVVDFENFSPDIQYNLCKMPFLTLGRLTARLALHYGMKDKEVLKQMRDVVKSIDEEEDALKKNQQLIFSSGSQVIELQPSIDYDRESRVFSFGFRRLIKRETETLEPFFSIFSRDNQIMYSQESTEVVDISQLGIQKKVIYQPGGKFTCVDGADAPWDIKNIYDFLHENTDYDRRVFNRLIRYFKERVALRDEGGYFVLAAFTILTYIFPRFNAVPYLQINGPKLSGKSEILKALKAVVFNGLYLQSISKSEVGKELTRSRATLILDQQESMTDDFIEKKPDLRDMVSYLASSYIAGGGARQVTDMQQNSNKKNEPTASLTSSYGPKVFASFLSLARDLQDRCIRIITSAFDSSELLARGVLLTPPTEDYFVKFAAELRPDLYRLAIYDGQNISDLEQKLRGSSNLNAREEQLVSPLRAIIQFFGGDSSFLEEYVKTSRCAQTMEDQMQSFKFKCAAVGVLSATHAKTKLIPGKSCQLSLDELFPYFPQSVYFKHENEELKPRAFANLVKDMQLTQRFIRVGSIYKYEFSYETLRMQIKNFFSQYGGLTVDELFEDFSEEIKGRSR